MKSNNKTIRGEDNDLILSLMLKEEIEKARAKNSLKTICESIGIETI
jgi:hypothetical protein